jgi:hypothetical protein
MMNRATIERPTDRRDELRAPRDRIRLLTIPERRFVMIDGSGRPGSAVFEPRMPGLYGIAYPLRFTLKRRDVEGKVGPLEGLWWTSDGNVDLDTIFGHGDDGTWRWTLMIGLPDEATDAEIEGHLTTARDTLDPALAPTLRVERFEDGPSAQVMHVGPYTDERPTIELLHAGIEEAGLRPRGRHHEIYLSDPRRSAPERLRTILRHPVE